jgi:hypothetical protein
MNALDGVRNGLFTHMYTCTHQVWRAALAFGKPLKMVWELKTCQGRWFARGACGVKSEE